MLVFFTLLGLPDHGWSSDNWLPYGARPVALGHAFIAPPHDAVHLNFNPASMAYYPNHLFQTDYANLFGEDIYYTHLGYIAPFGRRWANLGISWSRLALDNNIIGYSENEISVGIARHFSRKIKVGALMKVILTDFTASINQSTSARGLGFDVGALWRFNQHLDLGLRVHDLNDTVLQPRDGQDYVWSDWGIQAGFCYQFAPQFLILAALSKEALHTGAEFQPYPWISLRTGFQQDRQAEDDYNLSGGFGIALKNLTVDYAYQTHTTLPDNHYLSLSLELEERGHVVRIERVQLIDLFPTLYPGYSRNPIGRVVVSNRGLNPCQVSIGTTLENYTSNEPALIEWIEVKPGQSESIPVYIYLNESVLTREISGPVSVKIWCKSRCDNERVITHFGETILYSGTALTWEDPRKVAAFVFPTSEVVDEFVRETIRNHLDDMPAYLPSALGQAIQLFDTFGETGYQYKPDPHRPFSKAVYLADEVDTVQDPVQTISRRTGDCDDLVVLYAACLENLGINTAIADFPGHLFLMFNLGDDPISSELEQLFGIEWDGDIWFPVEMTLIGKPWYMANETGLIQFEAWRDHPNFTVFRISDGWQSYPPVKFPTEIRVVTVNPANRLLAQDYQQIAAELEQRVRRGLSEYQLNSAADSINVLAMEYSRVGLYQAAADLLTANLKNNMESVTFMNNLGNVYAMMGKYNEAVMYLQKALELAPDDADLHINLAYLLHRLKQYEKARMMYLRARNLNPEIPLDPLFEKEK